MVTKRGERRKSRSQEGRLVVNARSVGEPRRVAAGGGDVPGEGGGIKLKKGFRPEPRVGFFV